MKWLLIFLAVSILVYGEEEPEMPSGISPKQAVIGDDCMVVSANPHATQAGLETLLKGGNAVDAAIVMQFVLNVVEPQSSGIGGGAFLLYYDKKTDQVKAYDGRETAPQGVDENWFLGADHQPMPRMHAMVGGRSVGVPGVVKLLEQVHQQYGVLPWKELFVPAIKLAVGGFPISSRLHKLLAQAPFLSPQSTPYLFQDGNLKQEGEILKNTELATSFYTLAEQGSDAFYHGKLAEGIVQAVKARGGVMTFEDLAGYQIKMRDPLVTSFGGYSIYGFPPPSSGGIAVAQMLAILQEFERTGFTLGSAPFIDLFCRSSRMAFADRDYYVADPDFFPVPVDRLVDPDYLHKRAEAVRKHEKTAPGHYPGESLTCCPPMTLSSELELPSTTQICVIDSIGNCLSMTSSIENAFGSTVMTGGFFLNNQLTDFSLVPEKEGKRAANRIEPGKRPASSMAPTLVFRTVAEKKQIYLNLGSAGGSRIIDYVAKALCGVLLFDLNIQEAIAFPNFASLSDVIDLEENTFLVQSVAELEAMGAVVKTMPLTSGSQGIQCLDGQLMGGVDPRREGEAKGQ